MIDINNDKNNEPLAKFIKEYELALRLDQSNIEAACLSSISQNYTPDARFVNIKYINSNEFIFFSNYTSKKGRDIDFINKVALTFFWHKTNVQIRIQGSISKLIDERSDYHWVKRDNNKNALSISSQQSCEAESYESIIKKHKTVLENTNIMKRPKYWGGYAIEPIYYEFWQGNEYRINKRIAYRKDKQNWKNYFLQP